MNRKYGHYYRGRRKNFWRMLMFSILNIKFSKCEQVPYARHYTSPTEHVQNQVWITPEGTPERSDGRMTTTAETPKYRGLKTLEIHRPILSYIGETSQQIRLNLFRLHLTSISENRYSNAFPPPSLQHPSLQD